MELQTIDIIDHIINPHIAQNWEYLHGLADKTDLYLDAEY